MKRIWNSPVVSGLDVNMTLGGGTQDVAEAQALDTTKNNWMSDPTAVQWDSRRGTVCYGTKYDPANPGAWPES